MSRERTKPLVRRRYRSESIPAVTSAIPGDLRAFVDRVRERLHPSSEHSPQNVVAPVEEKLDKLIKDLKFGRFEIGVQARDKTGDAITLEAMRRYIEARLGEITRDDLERIERGESLEEPEPESGE